LGHTLDVLSLSDHAHIMGWQKWQPRVDIKRELPGVFRNGLADRFYQEYRQEFARYDGFVCCYPPAMSLLFRRFGKPIILHIPIRYEHPFTFDRQAWERFNAWLVERSEQGVLIPVANNVYDQQYYNAFVKPHPDDKCMLIESMCDYTGARWTGKLPWIYDSLTRRATDVLWKRDLFPSGGGHSWQDIADRQGIALWPYNVSTMSIYEYYVAGIPMVAPRHEDLMTCLEQSSWARTMNRPYEHCGIKLDVDPNGNHATEWAAAYADFYRLPNIPVGDCDGLDLDDIHEAMMAHNKVRKQRILEQWEGVFNCL
jgi:hypothetical protein